VTDGIIDIAGGMDDLARLGFTGRVEALFATLAADGFEPARIVRVDRGMPLAATATGVVRVEPATHLVKTAGEAGSRAAVGDWVALLRLETHEMPIIEAILPRSGTFSRKDPGAETEQQVLIANVDVVFVVQSLSGGGVNLRRLERELVLAWESGATPVVVLTKADLVQDPEAEADAVREIALGVDVVVESAITGLGIEDVRVHVPAGTTAALLGSSGVGKSTLVNRLVDEEVLETRATREADDKGRHTTVAREMFLVPGGGVIVDTPGMRGLALWDAEEGMSAAFPDIEQLAAACRFADCRHISEPGCAVLAAVESGELAARRLDSWQRLREELDNLAVRQDERAWSQKEKREGKVMGRAIKRFHKDSDKRRGRD
jgi:ribosome biogenesis GTPase